MLWYRRCGLMLNFERKNCNGVYQLERFVACRLLDSVGAFAAGCRHVPGEMLDAERDLPQPDRRVEELLDDRRTGGLIEIAAVQEVTALHDREQPRVQSRGTLLEG